MAMRLTPESARRILTELVENQTHRIFLTDHVKERMLERGITRKQVFCCLRNGHFLDGPNWSDNRNWEMKLEVLSAGDPVIVVAALDHDSNGNYSVVITTYIK